MQSPSSAPAFSVTCLLAWQDVRGPARAAGHLYPPEFPEDQTLISQLAPRAISFCLTLTSSRCSPCFCILVFSSLARQSCWVQIYCHFPQLRHPFVGLTLPFSCCPISLLLCLVCPSHTLLSPLQRLEHSHCH